MTVFYCLVCAKCPEANTVLVQLDTRLRQKKVFLCKAHLQGEEPDVDIMYDRLGNAEHIMINRTKEAA
jgi:hypothetical protein